METDQGARPATPPPPAILAHATDRLSEPTAALRGQFHSAASLEVTRWSGLCPILEGPAEDGAEAAIAAEYQQRIAGLRRLRRPERAAALRAARDWRASALKALRQKRENERYARHAHWRWQMQQLRMPKP